MTNTDLELQSEDLILSLDSVEKETPGFVKSPSKEVHTGQYAKVLASAYIQFTAEGGSLGELESVQNFIALSELHRDLEDQAKLFLQQEVSFIYEGQPLGPLLLRFSAFRLSQISQLFYFASLENQPKSILEDLKQVIQQRQEEYELLLKYL